MAKLESVTAMVDGDPLWSVGKNRADVIVPAIIETYRNNIYFSVVSVYGNMVVETNGHDLAVRLLRGHKFQTERFS